VGSPRRLLRFVALFASAGALAVAAAPANASPEDDARATAVAFADALVGDDADRICSFFSPGALRRLGGAEKCRASQSEDESETDYGAVETLFRAHTAAKLSATKRNGQYVTKKFRPQKLARDMEQLDSDLTVKLARNSAAVKGELDTTVALDTRSTARRLVLYAESDDGTIFRLSAGRAGQPRIQEVGFGIPEGSPRPSEPSTPSFSASIESVTVDTAGTAFARGTFTVTEDDKTFKFSVMIVLVPLNGTYFVDDIMYSTLSDGS
jgi:hypothetical protein